MSRLFQIAEPDLAELEHILPQIARSLWPVLDNRLRTQVRRVQGIISDVRWGYGPPSEVEQIPADGGEPT